MASDTPVDAANGATDHTRLESWVRAHTPARVLIDRSGPAYRTATQLELQEDLAAARDAVGAELDLERDLGRELVARWSLFEVRTQAGSHAEYLMRPDLGRHFEVAARQEVARCCRVGADLQIAIGDGLSGAAVAKQVPRVLPLLAEQAGERGWTIGTPFFIRYCRVGILNEIGELLDPVVVVLLIGERPGLSTAESLSAYMAYRPRPGHTDAHRNLISNIHARGLPTERAVRRIVALAEEMTRTRTSGVAIKESLASPEAPASLAVDRGASSDGPAVPETRPTSRRSPAKRPRSPKLDRAR